MRTALKALWRRIVGRAHWCPYCGRPWRCGEADCAEYMVACHRTDCESVMRARVVRPKGETRR